VCSRPFFTRGCRVRAIALSALAAQDLGSGHRMVTEESTVRVRVAGRRVFDANGGRPRFTDFSVLLRGGACGGNEPREPVEQVTGFQKARARGELSVDVFESLSSTASSTSDDAASGGEGSAGLVEAWAPVPGFRHGTPSNAAASARN
jgi:hypothetical protein